jgi:hypothetical protein
MPTLTRTEVAKRLGKSVATVRRLEGHVLFPAKDWRGVHRFDEWEVERLEKNPERTQRWARSRWFEQRRTDGRRARALVAQGGASRRLAGTFPGASSSDATIAALSELVGHLLECDADELYQLGVRPRFIAALARVAEELTLLHV